MALILNPYGGGTVVGKVGGKVFQRGSFGQVLRNLALPVNPSSNRQNIVRGRMSELAYDWANTLDETQRERWEMYALGTPTPGKLGTSVFLKGRSWFIRNNFLFLSSGTPKRVNAPVLPGLAAERMPILTATDAGGLFVDSVEPALIAGDRLQFQVSIPVNSSRTFYKGPWPIVTSFFEFTDVFPFLLKPPADVFIGQRYFVSCRIQMGIGKIAALKTGFIDCVA